MNRNFISGQAGFYTNHADNRYEDKRPRPNDRDENSSTVEVILTGKALPVLSQVSVHLFCHIHS
jgi:hypothetical protein